MTTISEREAEIAGELRPVLAAHFPGPVPDALVRELAVLTSDLIARNVERHARTPLSQQDPHRRRERGEDRRSA